MYFDGGIMDHSSWRTGCCGWNCTHFAPEPRHLRAFSLTEPCTNNVAEYNALLIDLQLALQLGVRNLQAYGDSELIVNQLRGEYKVRSDDLIPYFNFALQMAEQFEGFYIGHVPRLDNTHADALASLATSLCLQVGGMPNCDDLRKEPLPPKVDRTQRSN